jgi:hypothetical protein
MQSPPWGATALLRAGIDSDVIKLLGQWKSNAMFRYLRIQAHIHQDNISQQMLDHGFYTFAPGKFVMAANMPSPDRPLVPLLMLLITTRLTTEAYNNNLPSYFSLPTCLWPWDWPP